MANALLSLGPDVTYALLNGSTAFGAGMLGSNGIFASLLTLRDLVAGALKPPVAVTPLAAAADVPAEAVTTVTLAVSPAADAARATAETAVVTPSGAPETGVVATVSEETSETEEAPEDIATPTEESEVTSADAESDTDTDTDTETDTDTDGDSSATAPDSDAHAGPVRGRNAAGGEVGQVAHEQRVIEQFKRFQLKRWFVGQRRGVAPDTTQASSGGRGLQWFSDDA